MTLRNPTGAAWSALAIPSLELVPEDDPDLLYWAPFRLSSHQHPSRRPRRTVWIFHPMES